MKSKRAKEYIQDKDNQLWGVSMGVPLYITFDVEKAVTLAEQDAEERAVEAFEQWGDTWLNSLPCHIREVATNSYKELLNGGQSNDE